MIIYFYKLIKFNQQMIFDLKDIFKNVMHSTSRANTNHEVTIFEVDGMIQKMRNRISLEESRTFPCSLIKRFSFKVSSLLM